MLERRLFAGKLGIPSVVTCKMGYAKQQLDDEPLTYRRCAGRCHKRYIESALTDLSYGCVEVWFCKVCAEELDDEEREA